MSMVRMRQLVIRQKTFRFTAGGHGVRSPLSSKVSSDQESKKKKKNNNLSQNEFLTSKLPYLWMEIIGYTYC